MSAQPDLFLGSAADTRGEFASTPSWVIRSALNLLPTSAFGRVLDAGAGLGALGMAVENYARVLHHRTAKVTAVELERDRCELLPDHWTVHPQDFLPWAALTAATPEADRFDLVVCNPPFTRWLEWAQACLPLLAPKGCLLMVGPLSYLGGVERGGWLADKPPARVFVHCRRPRGQGWDDTREIAVCVWQENLRHADTSLAWVR